MRPLIHQNFMFLHKIHPFTDDIVTAVGEIKHRSLTNAKQRTRSVRMRCLTLT